MSRTFRRKGERAELARNLAHYFDRCPRSGEPHWTVHFSARLKGEQALDEAMVRRIITAEFHQDSHPGDRNAPAAFRQVRNRRARRLDAALLRRAAVQGEDPLLPVRRRSANWDWF